MSIGSALARLKIIAEETPGAKLVFSPSHTLGVNNFWFEYGSGGFVIPTTEGREVIDLDFLLALKKQRGASANRAAFNEKSYALIRLVVLRFLDVDLWDRPTSGIKRLTVPGRESMSWSVEGEDEDHVAYKVSFPLEFT